MNFTRTSSKRKPFLECLTYMELPSKSFRTWYQIPIYQLILSLLRYYSRNLIKKAVGEFDWIFRYVCTANIKALYVST